MLVQTLHGNDLSHAIKQTNLEHVKKSLEQVKTDLMTEEIAQYTDLAKKIAHLRRDQFSTGEKLYNAWLAPTAQIFPATIASWCFSAACFIGMAGKAYSVSRKSYSKDIELELITIPGYFLGSLLINRFVRHYFEYRALKNQYEDALSIEELLAAIKK